MPIPTPFHSRTAPLCETHEWGDWAGYLAAAAYDKLHEYEYYAIRNAAALIDVSPLFKYEISGPDALRLVNRIVTRDVRRCAVGQVLYTPWCDDDGKVIDDGAVARLDEQHFRITAADPNLAWFEDCGYGMDVQVRDVSQQLAALALQGPNARAILQALDTGIDLAQLAYFRLAQGALGAASLTITRTGYTGDLGYELWIAAEHAPALWDALLQAGRGYGLAPAGMAALDMARIEAGLLLIEVDYKSSARALIEAQKSSPYEIGLGWTVDLGKDSFVGRAALQAEQRRGSAWQFVGLEMDWESFRQYYTALDLAPQVSRRASRLAVPIYREGSQIGQATSISFSPILKKYIALGSVLRPHGAMGTAVEMEITVEYVRHRAAAQIVKTPFFDPPRKRI